jgi:hypothetical protein
MVAVNILKMPHHRVIKFSKEFSLRKVFLLSKKQFEEFGSIKFKILNEIKIMFMM